MSVTIELPHVGESVVEGTIGKWLKKPGDKVKRYEPLVEIITDKVTMEVPSPVEGSLVKLLAEEGETLPMGAPIAEVATADSPEGAEPETASVEIETAEPAPAAAPESPGTTGYLLRDVTPVGPTGGAAVELAEPTGAPTQPPARRASAPAPAPTATASAAAAQPSSGQTRLSPAVRRLAQEHSIDVSRVPGTGLGGRITRDDVLKFIESGAAQAPAPTTPAAAAPARQLAGETSANGDETHVPVSPIRRMIADAMVRSVTEIPHAWTTVEVDVTGLVALRASIRAEYEQNQGGSLTYLPFVIKAVVEALREFPTMNATWGGDKITLKNRINLGLAVAAPDGLIVPVLHNADQFSIAGLAAGAINLADRARTKKLTLDDVQGGTFTLNNTGALGSYVSGPIINYPQAGILTTETIQKRAIVIDDAIAIRSMMNLCLSFDHRINDGAEASGFISAVKNKLQKMAPGTSIY
jgi:2-oxoisovalerate dehydrogenase E2 component (dihydrolipoyl transacylase)